MIGVTRPDKAIGQIGHVYKCEQRIGDSRELD
jgi:hypothetical protein